MKKIIKYLGIFLSVVLMGAFTSCRVEEPDGPAALGLNVKVFFPTKVVTGQPMTINGSGLADTKEIVFPGDVIVTNFELVSDEMIRLTAPAGIAAEGGKLIVRTSNEEAESRLPLTLGKTVVSGYSKQAGESAEGGELITIYGKDVEFINGVELLDSEGNPNLVKDADFYRKGTNSVIFYVPRKNIFEGTFAGTVHTYDGQTFTMPELAYKPAKDSGYWEIQKTMIWENDGSVGPASWSGSPYRFCVEGHETGEQVAAIPADLWEKMKTGPFYITIRPEADWFQVRVVDGWWSQTWGGGDQNDIKPGDERLVDNGDGTFSIEIVFGDDPIVGTIDEKHLLFAGDAYSLMNIYLAEEVWVVGEEGHWERKVFWKNDGSKGAVDWGNVNYRFGLDGNDGGNECIATFPADVWSIIKDGIFRISFDCNESSNIRITTGWWSASYGGTEHNCMDMIQEEEDGTKYIEINIKEEGSLYDLIDQQHFLITGSGCTPLEIYVNEWVEGGGGADPEIDLKDFITYEQPDPAFSYPYYPSWGDNTGKLRIKRDNGLKELGLQAGKSKFIFYKTPGTKGQIQINNPNWTALTTVADWEGDLEILEYVLDEDAIKCITGETSDGWSETAIILQGDGLEVTKMTVLP